MHDRDRQGGTEHPGDASPDLSETAPTPDDDTAHDAFDGTLIEEIGALIDDGRTYAAAEIAFQKARAKFTGRTVGIALVQLVLAVILLHIAFLALAVGLVIALAPLVTVWGAIGIVFGGLLLIVAILVMLAVKRGKRLGAYFSSDKSGDAS